MKRTRPIQQAVVGFMAVLLVTGSAGATTARAESIEQTAEIEVTGIMHEAPRYDSPDHEWVEAQPPLNMGEGAKIYYEFTNNGPDAAVVTFKVVRQGMDDNHTGYNFLTVPIRMFGFSGPGSGPSKNCRSRSDWHTVVTTCTFSMPPGGSYWMEWGTGKVQAPGRVKATAEAWSDVTDPDLANNSLTLIDEKVRCSIEGTSGDDVLSGTSAADSICARAGNDTIRDVGPGDAVFGERGDDLLIPGVDEPGELILAGGPGWDKITYRRWRMGVRINWTGIGPAKGGTVLQVAALDGTLSGISHVLGDMEVLGGSAFHDRLEGGPGREIIQGGAGPDDIKGERGRDVLVGGRGNDLFHSRERFSDRILGGRGRDGAYADRTDKLLSVRRLSENPFADDRF